MDVLETHWLVTGRLAVLAGWLCVAAALYFAVRHPAANAFLTLPLTGLGGIQLAGGVSYGRASAALGMCALLGVLVRQQRASVVPLLTVVRRSSLAWLVGLCVVIALKIAFETALYGLDATRVARLSHSLINMMFPLAILISALSRGRLETIVKDLLLGMCVFSLLMLVAIIPYIIDGGLLWSALSGSARLSIGGIDTINSAKVFAVGMIGCMGFAAAHGFRAGRLGWTPLLLLAGASFGGMIILTGTRQFALSVAAFLGLLGFTYSGGRVWKKFASGLALLIVIRVVYAVVMSEDLAISRRLSVEAIGSELEVSRGAIWSQGLASALANPLFGTGFANFGEEYPTLDATGGVKMVRDTVHGVWQDVFVEHGMLLGIAFLIGSGQLIKRAWCIIVDKESDRGVKVFVAGMLALSPALLFSGVFLNATQLFMLLLVAVGSDAEGGKIGLGKMVGATALRKSQTRAVAVLER